MCVCVREKNMKAARWREQERRYHMTVITLFPESALQTKGSLKQNRQMGTPGGNFPAPSARKEIHVRLSEQKKNQQKNVIVVNKCRLFLEIGVQTRRWFNHRGPKPTSQQSKCVDVPAVSKGLCCHSQILDEVERRRGVSAALVYPFMRSLMESPFPAPGKLIKVKTFLPGAGNEVRAAGTLFTLYFNPGR